MPQSQRRPRTRDGRRVAPEASRARSSHLQPRRLGQRASRRRSPHAQSAKSFRALRRFHDVEDRKLGDARKRP
eukprot:12487935-Alexandrium_andersonii.AAC.1